MVHLGEEFDMRRGEIVEYRGSENSVYSQEMPRRTHRASFASGIWKNGGEDESILMEKWLTFHDRKWLIFKRPLTCLPCISNGSMVLLSFFEAKHLEKARE